VTIAKRPSERRDGEGYATDLGEARNEKFFAKGLDSKFARQPVGQITRRVATTVVVPANAGTHTLRLHVLVRC
jgi:hypothetical protein